MSPSPTPPSTWYSGPLSPQQLNQDLYSIDGTGYKATGLLFHAHRVLMHESLSQSRAVTVSTTGTWSQITGTNTNAFNIIDTGALFGQGCDNPGGNALYQFIPNALATSGVPIQPGNVAPAATAAQASSPQPAYPVGAGGNYLVFHTVTGQTAGTTPAAIGAGLFQDPGFGEVFVWQGGMQPHTAGTQGAAYFLDLINAGGGSYGAVSSPVARQQICTTLLPQGNGWVADWAVAISGTASSADVNNFSLVLGTQTVATSTNAGAIGTYSQTPYTANSTVPSGEFLSVTAGVTTPTSQATYTAEIYGAGIPTVGNAYTWQPAVFLADGTTTTEQLPANGTDTAGFTPRHSWVWASVSYKGQLVTLNPNAYAADGNLTGWTASNGTITAVTGAALPGNPLQPQPYGVQLTANGSASTCHAASGPFSCTAGTQYQITTGLFMPGAYYGDVGVDWYDTFGDYVSTTSLATKPTVAAATWTPLTLWATAPPGAATGIPWAGMSSGSTGPTYAPVGVPGSGRPGRLRPGSFNVL